MLNWWAHWRAKDTDTRTSLAFRTPTHTQHKEISPFSATQSLRPSSPFQCYSGVVENKSSSVALSVWFSTHQVYQSPQALIHYSIAVRGQNHCMQATNNYSRFYRGKTQSIRRGQTVAHNNYETTAPNPQGNWFSICAWGEKDTAKEKSGRDHRPHSVGTHNIQLILNTIIVEFA